MRTSFVSIILSLLLTVFSFSASYGQNGGNNQRFFLYTKTTMVSGLTAWESCRARLKVTIRGVRPGPGNVIYCKIHFDAAVSGSKSTNITGSK